MASSLLEQTRSLHEDLEVLERAMTKELGDPSTAKLKRPDQIARDQVVATLLSAHQTRSGHLARLYEDADGARKEEIASVSGATVFSAFYDQLKSIREYHRKFPSAPSTESAEMALVSEVLDDAPEEGFTGEEAEGRFVDMHSLHDAFLNLKGVERIDYCTYLKQCANLAALPKGTALAGGYLRYAKALRDYWLSFLRRTQPLMPLDKLLEAAEADLKSRWAKGEITRWQQPSAAAAEAAAIDLAAYASAAALEAVGMEALKVELTRQGLKCGGNLKQRAERLFLLKTAPLAQIPKKELAKAATTPATVTNGHSSAAANGSGSGEGGEGGEGGGGGGGGGGAAWQVALAEEHVSRLGELLVDVLEDTATMVEKKQARTYDEIERDLALAAEEEALVVEDEDEEEEDKPIYNPLNLPLGWDGKPIPYWLYKLHGLNLEFKCEICGNYSYWGPRPFERHFQEWRHAYGMKCLGIPNSKHFQGITLIEDAYTLWAKLRAEQGSTSFNAELDEEFEDGMGNVMNRKTYGDLARQGLLD